MLDLNSARGRDLRTLSSGGLEEWVIRGAGRVHCHRRAPPRPRRRLGGAPREAAPARTARPAEDKIAAIGVRLRHWVSFHGLSINVEPELAHYDGIIPCGIAEHGVTSLVDLGLPVTMADLDLALARTFDAALGAGGR